MFEEDQIDEPGVPFLENLMRTLVEKTDNALECASRKIVGDKEITLGAVKPNGIELEVASEELQKNRDNLMEALEQNEDALEIVSKETWREEILRWRLLIKRVFFQVWAPKE